MHHFAALVIIAVAAVFADARDARSQETPSGEFEIVSIKPSVEGADRAGIRTLPDGTVIMVNQPIRSVILNASPVPTREVVGLPAWAMTDRYDLTAKPPAGATTQQKGEMWRKMFADRMKLVAHVEEREREAFALMLDRADGRLGPQLTPSTLNCSQPPPLPAPGASPPDPAARCGMRMSATAIVSGGISFNQFVQSLTGLAGGLVNNRTGLPGFYALNLTFSRERWAGAAGDSRADDLPDFTTALREQLGLKLVPEKVRMPVLVIDSIERPTEN